MNVQFGMAFSNAGGFEHKFLEPSVELKKFECPVCLHVTRDPHLTDCCGQHFCQACIQRVIINQKPCPLCNTNTFSVMLDKKQKRNVLDLRVECTRKESGCDWSGRLGELDMHVDLQNGSCQFVSISCPNNCGESHQRSLLANHLKDLCPKRSFSCQYCMLGGTYEYICDKHHIQCNKYPVPCPNVCEIGTVERGNLEEHVSECPLQVVKCEFAHAGCSEKITRRDLPKHMELNMHKHLLLVSTFTMDIKMDIQRQVAEKTELLKMKLEQMEKRLHEKDYLLRGMVYTLQTATGVSVLTPVEFTTKYSQYKAKNKRVEGPVIYTHPMGAKVQVCVLFADHIYGNEVQVELWQLPGEFDQTISWPLKCTVTAQLFNQSSDQHHIRRSVDFHLSRPTERYRQHPDVLRIDYSTMSDRSQKDKKYLKHDSLKFEVDVSSDQKLLL